MHCHFFLKFHTRIGQSLWIKIQSVNTEDDSAGQLFPLTYLNEEVWDFEYDVPEGQNSIHYNYLLKGEEGIIVEEGETERTIYFTDKNITKTEIIDIWNFAGEYENVFHSSAFSNVLFAKHHKEKKKNNATGAAQQFRVKAPLLKKNEAIVLIGSGKTLGNWSTIDPLLMIRQEILNWNIILNTDLIYIKFLNQRYL